MLKFVNLYVGTLYDSEYRELFIVEFEVAFSGKLDKMTYRSLFQLRLFYDFFHIMWLSE